MFRRIVATAALLAPLALSAHALAQGETPDTTSAWRYFPLEVGNVWEYLSEYDGEQHFERRTVAADTLIDGTRYFRYEQQAVTPTGEPVGGRSTSFVRFDTLSTEIRWWEEAERPPYDVLPDCPLGVPFGSEQECPAPFGGSCTTTISGGYGGIVEIGDDVVVTTLKLLDTQGCEIVSLFGADLGFVRFVTLGAYTELRYALVGGVEYGEPFTVDVEGTPSPVPDLDVTTFPNPSRRSLTVTLSQREAEHVRVAIYDVRGRRVAVLHDGPLAAGAHRFALDAQALPSGVYLVRAEVGVSSGAMRALSDRFTVVR